MVSGRLAVIWSYAEEEGGGVSISMCNDSCYPKNPKLQRVLAVVCWRLGALDRDIRLDSRQFWLIACRTSLESGSCAMSTLEARSRWYARIAVRSTQHWQQYVAELRTAAAW